jgi:hypothetical protein
MTHAALIYCVCWAGGYLLLHKADGCKVPARLIAPFSPHYSTRMLAVHYDKYFHGT